MISCSLNIVVVVWFGFIFIFLLACFEIKMTVNMDEFYYNYTNMTNDWIGLLMI